MRSSSKSRRKHPPRKIASRADLKELQRFMAQALLRPLNKENQMQRTWKDGRSMEEVAASFIKPNDRLTSFERLEIYNRQYWFRVLDCFYDDYAGLRAVLGEKKFVRLAEAYLIKYPSASFTLRNLGSRLDRFLQEEPEWVAPHRDMALEMVRFEWAQIVAFDGETLPILGPAEIQKAKPSRLKLGLQPYLSFLELHYAVDDFSIAIKRQDALRGEASNAFESAPKVRKGKKVRLPKREKTPLYVAVQRYDNALYYKRLEPEAYRLLLAIRNGATLTQACDQALRHVAQNAEAWSPRIQAWFANWSGLGWFCRPPTTHRKIKS